MGFTTLLEEECSDSLSIQSFDYLRRIRDSANRLDRLITDALNYDKVVRQRLPMTEIEICKLLRGIIESYPDLQPSPPTLPLNLTNYSSWATSRC